MILLPSNEQSEADNHDMKKSHKQEAVLQYQQFQAEACVRHLYALRILGVVYVIICVRYILNNYVPL